MRVLFAMANNSTTPYFSRFARLAADDNRISPEFLCLHSERPAMIDEMKRYGFRCHWISYDSNRRLRGMVRCYFEAKRLLKQRAPDVVHCHLFDDALPVLWAAKNVGVPRRVISKLDAGFHFHYAPHWSPMDRMNNRNATDIVCVSSSNRQFVLEKEGAPREKVTLIPQGLPESEVVTRDPDLIQRMKKKYTCGHSPVVLTVARYLNIKGYPELIRASKTVVEKYPNVRFLCVGYGDDKERYMKMAGELGVASSVVLTGRLKREELNALYSLADVFCHPAIEEPYGFVILEAILNQLPVVCSRKGIAVDAVSEGQNGLLVEPGDADNLARGIVEMLNGDHRDACLLAYKRAKQKYSAKAMWDAHVQLYLNDKSRCR